VLITVTELKENIGKYLALADSEDIIITKNGKQVAKLTTINNGNSLLTDSLIGVIPNPAVEQARLREERLMRHESTH
jgi:prevent-host-death family protein